MEAVIVSWAKNHILAEVTQYAIDTALMSGITKVIVVEQNQSIFYNNADMVNFTGEFNYNKALNLGLSKCSERYVALCNNDVIFHEGFVKAEKIMEQYGIKSASPCGEGEDIGEPFRKGYRIKREMRGWCIIIDKEILQTIGKLDETYTFHYSDNAYADQLKAAGIEHYLLNGVELTHLVSRTLKTESLERRRQLTREQRYKYKGYGRSIHIQARKGRQPRPKVLVEKSRKHATRKSIRGRR